MYMSADLNICSLHVFPLCNILKNINIVLYSGVFGNIFFEGGGRGGGKNFSRVIKTQI